MALADDIIDKVNQEEKYTATLRQRWDDDYDLWQLTPKNTLGSKYKWHQSNEPRTNAKRAISLITGAALSVTVPQEKDDKATRAQDNDKERFIRGNLRANDQRLMRRAPYPMTLRGAMAWATFVRGYTMGRSMLVKKGDRSWADATPFDPRSCMWSFGPDGLEWLCRKYVTTRVSAELEYKVKSRSSDTKPTDAVLRYDYYDREHNIVIIPDIQSTPVKSGDRARHGLFDGYGDPVVPVWFAANMLQPFVGPVGDQSAMSNLQLSDHASDYGESFFADNRHVYPSENLIASIRLNLASRSLKPATSLKSKDGIKTIEYDPFIDGASFPLDEDSEWIVHDLLLTSPDAEFLSGKLADERQKGSFSAVSFGRISDPLSGFAITQLKSSESGQLMGAVAAVNQGYMQIGDNWCDHYVGGGFPVMELSGEGRNRKWFSGFITPDQIRDLPQAQIELTPELPEDQAAKVNLANQYMQPGADGLPTLSHRAVLEDVLHREDPDLDLDDILDQMAIENPIVKAVRMTDAAEARGDMDAAWAWFAQWLQLWQQMVQAGLQVQNVRPNLADQAGPSAAGGFPPEILPNSVQGQPPPTPGVRTPLQAGPVVPAGTPRPGAQNRNGNTGNPDIF